MKIAYLVNTYPSPSHSFIRREIQALERLGHEVHRFALRPTARPRWSIPATSRSWCGPSIVLRQGVRLPLALLTAMARSPRRAFGALRLAARLARVSARNPAYHLVYLAEAAYLAARCRELGIAHLHAHFGTNSATVAMLAAALGGPSFSFTAHGPEEFDRPDALALGEKIRTRRLHRRGQLLRPQPALPLGGVRRLGPDPRRALRHRARALSAGEPLAGRARPGSSRSDGSSSRRASCS